MFTLGENERCMFFEYIFIAGHDFDRHCQGKRCKNVLTSSEGRGISAIAYKGVESEGIQD